MLTFGVQRASRSTRWRMMLPKTLLSSLLLTPSTPLLSRATRARSAHGKSSDVRYHQPHSYAWFSRNAMDNASKNAGDMINNLQLKYNRGRQAAITNELVDIITGASAL